MIRGKGNAWLTKAIARLGAKHPTGQSPTETPVPPASQWHRELLLSIEQLEQHACELAASQQVTVRAGRPAAWLYAVDETEQFLRNTQELLAEDLRQQIPVSPAAEWLVDNFHVVLDQLREIRRDLPQSFYRELPKLAQGPLEGIPRVYAVALELISHTDGRITPEYLVRFIQAYQTVVPLSIGELWAVVIMLRIGLVEYLSHLAELLLDSRRQRAAAMDWAERLLQLRGAPDEDARIRQELASLMRDYPDLPPVFATELFRQLHSVDGDSTLHARSMWLEQALTARYGSSDGVLHLTYQGQAGNQVSVGNTITSMRILMAIDWPTWFEGVSLTEQVLRQDPAGIYGRCTFSTRDRYRHVVEQLAHAAAIDEMEVARRLIDAAARVPRPTDDGLDASAITTARPDTHIGYYLIGPGRAAFEARIGARRHWATAAGRALLAHPTPLYLGAIAAITGAVVAAGVRGARRDGRRDGWMAAGLLALPASELAQGLVNWGAARALKPRVLPRLDLVKGVPAELRTIVVVPMLLLTKASVESQFDRLEVLMLANSDPHIHFALLSDFADAPAIEMPEDTELLAVAQARVDALNMRHDSARFFFFHRRRVWNPVQACYMGWERKRGKLEEFNRLLAGADDTTFEIMRGDLPSLAQVRYVITLDADTQLPRDTAQKLIGTLAHPLNRAVVDPHSRRVVQGYGILQPRIAIDLPSATRSRFARIFSGNVGIDPYTTAVSDVYMDLFAEGIYAGKGIYEPAVLHETLEDRFPDNALLSHDLIEGSYARTGLLTDVELIDNYPSTYASYAARHHRWVRGDWQLVPWLMPWVPRRDGSLMRNTLPLIARYRIFDNLRRSLVPAGTVTLLAAGWLRFPDAPLVWTAAALAHLALPTVLTVIDTLLGLPGTQAPLTVLYTRSADVRMAFTRTLLNTTLLLDQAVLNLDAISRTLLRVYVTHRDMLQWETADQTEERLRGSARPIANRLAPTIGVGTALGWLGRRQLHRSWPVVAPVAGIWLSAPGVAAFLDRPWQRAREALASDGVLLLRTLARQTWRYFEEFVTEDVHFLAPDNFQEDPQPVLAKRTSPTNIGLQLLVDIAARDFGYIGLLDMTERTEQVFTTLEALDHYRGHLLNWYDIQTLKPLPPAYVSTVDSGNLAGYLLVLRQAYGGLCDQPIAGPWLYDGLRDALALLRQEVGFGSAPAIVAELVRLLNDPPQTIGGYRKLLVAFRKQLIALLEEDSMGVWAEKLDWQAQSLLRDLDALLPGEASLTLSPELSALAEGWPTLSELFAATEAGSDEQPLAGIDDVGHQDIARVHANLEALLIRQATIVAGALKHVEQMDFGFLFDAERLLFTIGYNVAEGRRDNSFYDLLASESRLGSFVTIATGEVPQSHWFHLGRPITIMRFGFEREMALRSWSGTMFEYLMPLLVMRDFPATLLDGTYHAVVDRQIAFGREQHVPWGISESAYNVRDMQMNYQYRAFGVSDLSIKGGLQEDVVIAPYATALALAVRPLAALDNIKVLIDAGAQGTYGLYEAIDYTPSRLPPGATHVVLRSYMVHHQGMSLLAFDNCLHDNIMQQRFQREPRVAATELLLQERAVAPAVEDIPAPARAMPSRVLPASRPEREFTTPHTRVPYTHLLSNGTYSVMLTNAGGGFSRCGDLLVTRWREDTTCDNWGSFCYIRDVRSALTWSPGYQPVRQLGQDYRVVFAPEKVEYHQRIAGIRTRMDVTVTPEDNAEVRNIYLTNLTVEQREIEVTSYAELVLASASADTAHPVFSKLFVETEFLAERDALLASRRPRAPHEQRVWAVHVMAVRGHTIGATQFDSDRSTFLGRGRTPANPAALDRPLAHQSGPVLDPIFSLRCHVRIPPGATAQIMFTTATAESREQAVGLAHKYQDPRVAGRAFELAWTRSRVELRHLGITTDDLHRFQRLAACAFYADGRMRAAPEILSVNTLAQPGLWPYGVSGDFPIIVVRVSESEHLDLVRELLLAHEVWRFRGLTVELVILNEQMGTYLEEFHQQLQALVRGSRSGGWLDHRGGIFVVRADRLPPADLILLQTAARAVLSGRRGNLAQHLRQRDPQPDNLPGALPITRTIAATSRPSPLAPVELIQPSAYGGFAPTGDAYIIELDGDRQTPLPWINVVANERFGFLVSESGSGYTWSENSRENRLTPWSNDPVVDPPGELIFVRDEASGACWHPTPYTRHTEPEDNAGSYRVRHGFGYSTFEHERRGIASELTLFVPPDDSVKLYRLRLRNTGSEPRRIGAIFYAELVLGVLREQLAPFVVTAWDEPSGALLAHNAYSIDFGTRVAFAASDEPVASWTCDRTEFIGRNGSLEQPAALARSGLAGRSGAALDPCAALQRIVELAPGEQCEVIFLLGQGSGQAEVEQLIARYRRPEEVAAAYTHTVDGWHDRLTRVQVRTPEPAWDVLLNGWLVYQTLACRLWGRSAFYQSGGAYGFRDQLQDVMGLVYAAPELVREHLLRAASRQFVEGDVQHWWHPPAGRGIRTHFSDDYLWLPFVTAFYIMVTGDRAALDEQIPFIEGRPLAPGEDEYYDLPSVSPQSASLYEHSVRAVEYALTRMGTHGLPLMGTGDWNDGMNQVGAGGKGESIWVGWFLHLNLQQFAAIAAGQGDQAREARYHAAAEQLQQAIEEHGWDGEWYLRAFFDDGTPLGSKQNDECQIDSIVQSWAVISGAADHVRASKGLDAVEHYLVDKQAGLIKLFMPPFDHGEHNPGYIKGYVPGVRENGGQYTHAALWYIWARAELGDGDRAGQLFSLINPVLHAQANAECYQVEPYVIAADIYAVPPLTGRGGWTWYTGSASWMYRLGVEMLLGLRKHGDWLEIAPCIPHSWPGYEVTYRYGSASFHIVIENPAGVSTGVTCVEVDGQPSQDGRIRLVDDGATHEVRVVLGHR